MKALAASIVAAMTVAGCSGEQPAAGNAITAAVAMPVASPRPAHPAPTASDKGDPASPGAAQEVARRFLTKAAAGDRDGALREWDGGRAAGAAALAALAERGSGAIRIGTPVDGDAGMSQRYVTIPFSIGTTRGRAVLHRVAEGILSDDPHAHDWRVRSLDVAAR